MGTALKFLSPGPRNDVTDHLAGGTWGGVGKREKPAARALGKAFSQANAVLVQIFISL